MRPRRLAVLGWTAITVAVAGAGCGLQVQSADLFLVTRTGPGHKLTMLVADDGTISCNGGKAKSLSDPLVLQARDLATSLNDDATAKRHFAAGPRSVYSYAVKVQNGTFTFPDTAAVRRKELSQLELFVVQAASSACGIAA